MTTASDEAGNVPVFRAGDKVWPKAAGPMILQQAPQTVIAVFSDLALGEWLWLDAGTGYFGSWAAVHWTTAGPDEAWHAARREAEKRVTADAEERVAALEEQAAHPMTGAQAAELRADLEEAMRQGPFPCRVIPPAPLLTPETARALAREYVTIIQPGEVLVIRVAGNWTPSMVRECQEAFESMAGYRDLDIAILFVPGEEFAVARPPAPAAPGPGGFMTDVAGRGNISVNSARDAMGLKPFEGTFAEHPFAGNAG